MSYSNQFAVLEVGTSRTVCLAGKFDSNRVLSLTGAGIVPTTGVRKGEIIDLNYAVAAVTDAARRLSQAARVDLRTVWLLYSGGGTECTPSTGLVTVMNRDGEVDQSDIELACERAAEEPLPQGHETLHNIVGDYLMDGNRVAHNPEGLPARKLQAALMRVHTAGRNLAAVKRVVEESRIEVSNCFFSGLCAAHAVLTPEQRLNGVLLVNLGGGTTTYVAYARGNVAAAGSFAVGGDHVTNDILHAFHLANTKAAEMLKINEGSAILDQIGANNRVAVPIASKTLGAQERTVSQRALCTVINARLDELFIILRKIMDSHGLLERFGAGVVLTGGGAYMRDLPQLVSRIFGCPCAIATMPPLDPIVENQPASLAAAYGALLLAERDFAEDAERRPRGIMNWFKKGGR